ncbi:MAG: hypothetical protein AB8B72_06335 [Crocinitomicaceae bacterium]
MIGLKEVLASPKNSLQLWLTFLGLLVGFSASVLAVVLIFDISQSKNSNSDVFGNNTIVVQKAVSNFTSLGLNSSDFSVEEILQIQKQEFITEVAPFKSANYEVGISENPGDGLPSFYAEMFLQSVPNSFISFIDSIIWQWQSEADEVPIILPQDFLTLVNYGIVPSKGIPQMSEELIKSVRFQLHLIGPKGKAKVKAKVVGFSSKITSVLVPEAFINFSNSKYGFKKVGNPSRLLIRSKAKSYGQLNGLIKKMNLEISENDLTISKISTYFMQMILLFFLFAFIILALSILALLQYLQLRLVELKYEVSLLTKLGYMQSSILKVVRQQFFKIVISLALAALLIVFIVKFSVIQPFMISMGIDGNYFGFIFGILFVILLLILSLTVLKKSVSKTILKIYKKA